MTRAVSRPSFAAAPGRFLALAFALALAGCGQSQPERNFAADPNAAVVGQFVAGRPLSAPVSPKDLRDDSASFAVLDLPYDAVRNGRVTEKQFLNGWRQSMSLDRTKEAGDWNDLSIDILAFAGTGGRGHLVLQKPTQEGVRREILSRFRGISMRIVNRPMHNALGPFGLAIGAGPGDMRCAFAWQWVENLPAAARGERGGASGNGEMTASIRMRLCRRGATADELAQWFEQLSVSRENIARAEDAMRRNMAIHGIDGQEGASGAVTAADTTPTGAIDSLESTLLGGGEGIAAPPREPARRVRRGSRRAAPAEAPGFAPASTIPVMPADGRRYLGPVSDMRGAAPQYAPVAAAAPSPPSAHGAGFGPALNAGLPAQAYRGPAGARAISPYGGQ